MGKAGELMSKSTWPQLLSDLKDVMRKWGNESYVLPTKAEAERSGGAVTFMYERRGKWATVKCQVKQVARDWNAPERNLKGIVDIMDAVRLADQRGLGSVLAQASSPLMLTSGQRTPHEILGVLPTSTAVEIKAAYIRRLKETHPDTGGDTTEFMKVRKAGEELGIA